MKPMKIAIFNNTEENITDLEKILKKVFKNIKNKNSCSIIFVSDEEIKDLNNRYRNINNKTDVLSFPNEDKTDKTLGDIFISLNVAKTQAKEYKHSLNREIAFLAVHGYLHLIGYDHNTKEEEKEMIELQEQILKKAKLERKYEKY